MALTFSLSSQEVQAYQQAVARHILQLHFALVLSHKQWKKGKDAEK